MKNYYVILLWLCIFLSCPVLGETLYPPDIQRIMEKGKIIVAMTAQDSPPFYMNDENGRLIGIDVELSRYLAKHLGVQAEFNREAKTFDGVVDVIVRRDADIAISILSITLERCKKVLYTEPYIVLYQALLMNRLVAAREKQKNDSLDILNRKNAVIAVIKGSSHAGWAREDFPSARIVPYESLKLAVEDVNKGVCWAFLYDDIEIRHWHEENPDDAIDLKTIVRYDKKDFIAIAVNREDSHLHFWLNQFLRKIESDGSKEKLIQKYLDTRKLRK